MFCLFINISLLFVTKQTHADNVRCRDVMLLGIKFQQLSQARTGREIENKNSTHSIVDEEKANVNAERSSLSKTPSGEAKSPSGEPQELAHSRQSHLKGGQR